MKTKDIEFTFSQNCVRYIMGLYVFLLVNALWITFWLVEWRC